MDTINNHNFTHIKTETTLGAYVPEFTIRLYQCQRCGIFKRYRTYCIEHLSYSDNGGNVFFAISHENEIPNCKETIMKRSLE
jgi:hypothetical protein